MKLKKPVSDEFPISAEFGKWGRFWNRHIASNGRWVRGQVDGKGQHKGIDFAVPEGTLVTAMADGLITAAGWENLHDTKQGFGLRVRQQIVTDSGAIYTVVYGHLSQLYVKAGQQVYLGDRIGFSGNTGHSSGPHLHIELVDSQLQYHPVEFDEEPPKTA